MSGDATKGYSHRTIDMTPEHYAKAIELAMAATDCTGFGPTPHANIIELVEQTKSQGDVWFAHDRENFAAAITGNGPTSEANARFFVDARAIVLGMAERIDHLETRLRNAEAELRKNGRHA